MPDIYFVPLVDFESDELKSHYIKGLRYTARPEDQTLLDLLPNWIGANKIVLVQAASSAIKGV